jgi:hypothetical protein
MAGGADRWAGLEHATTDLVVEVGRLRPVTWRGPAAEAYDAGLREAVAALEEAVADLAAATRAARVPQ